MCVVSGFRDLVIVGVWMVGLISSTAFGMHGSGASALSGFVYHVMAEINRYEGAYIVVITMNNIVLRIDRVSLCIFTFVSVT